VLVLQELDSGGYFKRNFPMKRIHLVSLVSITVAALFSAFPAHAENEYSGWRIRAWAGVTGRFIETDNATFTDPDFGDSSTEVDGTGFGFGIDVERRFTKLLGLDLAVGYTELDVEFTQSLTTTIATDTLKVLPIWLALNFHVVNTEKIDFWVGPQIAYVAWNDPLTFSATGQPTFEQETANHFPGLGLALGLDWWLTKNSGLNFAFRFVDADANENLLVDPTFITIGYGWKL
jgi:outer membrane protein W